MEVNLQIIRKIIDMEDSFDIIDNGINFTSAGTTHLSVKTSKGIEEVSIENISRLENYYKDTDLGRLYTEFPDHFAKIQKVTFRVQYFFNCYFYSNDEMKILKFDSEGKLSAD